nr:hypothetical protein [Nonomuraea aridisoli]
MTPISPRTWPRRRSSRRPGRCWAGAGRTRPRGCSRSRVTSSSTTSAARAGSSPCPFPRSSGCRRCTWPPSTCATRWSGCRSGIAGCWCSSTSRASRALPITWGTGTWDRGELAEGKEGCGVELGNFREWAGLLRDHDDANLRRFDLSLDRLRTAARDGLAYAYVADLVAIEKLRRILEDPRVRTVRLADVAFDLDRP